jgi:hypothetical protein
MLDRLNVTNVAAETYQEAVETDFRMGDVRDKVNNDGAQEFASV